MSTMKLSTSTSRWRAAIAAVVLSITGALSLGLATPANAALASDSQVLQSATNTGTDREGIGAVDKSKKADDGQVGVSGHCRRYNYYGRIVCHWVP